MRLDDHYGFSDEHVKPNLRARLRVPEHQLGTDDRRAHVDELADELGEPGYDHHCSPELDYDHGGADDNDHYGAHDYEHDHRSDDAADGAAQHDYDYSGNDDDRREHHHDDRSDNDDGAQHDDDNER